MSSRAATNRSIRTIKTELDFLLDSDLLTAAQVASIHALLPDAPTTAVNPIPAPIAATAASAFPSLASLRNASPFSNTNEKAPQPELSPIGPPPPSYAAASPAGPPSVASATALYAYNPTDVGDMTLGPNDHVAVLEFMNADWARGRNERTGQEGIFPRSYVRVEEEKEKKGIMGGMGNMGNMGGLMGPPPPQQGNGYGNAPLEVAQGGQGQGQAQGSKVNGTGKKIGKKVGNAALFGAGATIGSNIVNSIF